MMMLWKYRNKIQILFGSLIIKSSKKLNLIMTLNSEYAKTLFLTALPHDSDSSYPLRYCQQTAPVGKHGYGKTAEPLWMRMLL